MHIEVGQLLTPTGNGMPVNWNPEELINPHMIVTGDSGSGKTFNLRKFAAHLAQTAGPDLERIHIIDSHGDLDVQSSHVKFSQSTPYAFNPLEISSDPDYGGVRKSIANFLGMIERSSRKLGTSQQSVLRNILLDVYAMRGFNADNPSTWTLDGGDDAPAELPEGRVYLDIPFEEKELAKDCARRDGISLQFDTGLRCWWAPVHTEALARWPQKTWGKQFPTIHDVIAATRWRLKQLSVGTDQKGLLALEALCRSQAALARKVKDTRKRAASANEMEEVLQAERDKAADKAKDAMCNFIDKVATGAELDDLIQYDSAETLKGILDRLDNLKATGVCRSVTPPFDPLELAWRYGIAAYGDDEKRMFVDNLLERIFQRAIIRGPLPTSTVTDIIFLDEAPKFMVDDHEHIINRIINEARKYGVAIFLISQSPTQYPEQILAGVGCKIILGLDPLYNRLAATKLGIEQKYIDAIKPTKLILMNLKLKGAVAKWLPVSIGVGVSVKGYG